MDSVKAQQILAKLKGQKVGPWEVLELKNFGKSAAVFRATNGQLTVALKIFDNELIERYGDKTQLARIERELTLVGKIHENMVKILDGGFDDISENHYIVMEYLDGKNLKECLLDVPNENIGTLIEQLSSCGRFLEKLNLVHRDIKPENIVILENFTRLVLLDFGVLRPIGQPGLTDEGGIQQFVGTLQYTSPEFLLREEEDSVEGWRALTLYQIGGVLHDLIMRRPLFADQLQPYARLVNAVQHDIPSLQNPAIPSYLIDAARSALIKDPKIRTKMLTWENFFAPADEAAHITAAKHRVTGRSMLQQSVTPEPVVVADPAELIETVVNYLKIRVRAIRTGNSASLPPVVITRSGPKLFIRFRPSTLLGITDFISIELTVKVLDADAGAISLGALAYVGQTVPVGAPEPTLIYRGLFTSGEFSTALENCVYVTVDKIQTSPPGGQVSMSLEELDVGVE